MRASSPCATRRATSSALTRGSVQQGSVQAVERGLNVAGQRIRRVCVELSLLLTVALLLGGCGAVRVPLGGTDPLAGRTFLSTSVIREGAPRELLPGTRIRLHLADGQIAATAGCNTIGGSYRLRDGVLEVGALQLTEMGCPAPLADQDAWLAELLQAGPVAVVTGDALTLSAGTTRVTLLDRRVADPDRSLVGPEWIVESLIVNQTVSSVPGQTKASLTFQADGTMSVSPGCNTGSGRFVSESNTITITEIVLTRMACLDDRGELETNVLAVLETPRLGVRIEGASLMLMGDTTGLQLRAG